MCVRILVYESRRLFCAANLPRLTVLLHPKVKLFITNCANNAMLEGVHSFTPMITRPYFGNQPINSNALGIPFLNPNYKNIAGQVLTYKSKNFHWLNRKLNPERTMNGLGKQFRKKNAIQKIEKTVKIKVKLPHVNKKPLARKRIFVQTPFSHSTLKIKRKKITPQNHSLFRSTSCFSVTKITTPIWLQKS